MCGAHPPHPELMRLSVRPFSLPSPLVYLTCIMRTGDLCGTSRLPHHSAAGSLKAWTAAGFPASKLLLGLALYGYVSKSTKTVLTGSFAPEERGNGLVENGLVEDTTKPDAIAEEPQSDDDGSPLDPRLLPPHGHAKPKMGAGSVVWDEEGAEGLMSERTAKALANGSGSTLKTLAAKGDLSSFWGSQVAFNQLLSSGAMVKKADGTYGGGAGYTFGSSLSFLPPSSLLIEIGDSLGRL